MHTNLKACISNRFGMVTLGCILLLVPFIISATHSTLVFHLTNLSSVETPKLITLDEFAIPDRTIALKGSLIARSNGAMVTEVIFTMTNASSAKPLKLTDEALTISYQDQFQQIAHLSWSKRFQGDDNQNSLLDPGELVQITVPLSSVLATKLGPNTPFVLNVTPAQGAAIRFSRTTPDDFTTIMDLN